MKGAAKVVDFNADAEVEAAPLHPAATPVVASSEADKALTLKEASNISFGPRAETAGPKAAASREATTSVGARSLKTR